MTVWRLFALIALLGLFGCIAEKKGEYKPENLALNKPYTLNIKPDYQYCTDPGDAAQLTNGKMMKDVSVENCFWTNKETVGWSHPRKPVEITVDLGEMKPISGASFNTAAGRAGVNWPVMVNVMVSEDGQKFYKAAELTNADPRTMLLSAKGYTVYKYVVRDLRTKGRYVRFECTGAGTFLFCDEVEVFSGPAENLEIKLSDSGKENTENDIMTACVRKRMVCDIFLLRNEVEKAKISDDLKKDISDDLEKLENKALEYEFSGDAKNFRAIIPLNPLHAEVISQFARLLDGEGIKGLNIWHKDRYAKLTLFEKSMQERPELAVRMMNGEYRADVLNITNSEYEKVKLSINIDGLPGNPSEYLKVYEVKGVDSKDFKVDFSALVGLTPSSERSYLFETPSGMTSQLWFSFHPQKIESGTYKGNIKVCRDEEVIGNISLTLTISPVMFPAKTDFKCLLWDYSYPFSKSYAVGRGNLEETRTMFKEYFINVPVGSASIASIPSSKNFDKTGKLLHRPDFSTFDKWMELWPDAAAYHIFLYVTPENKKFAGFEPGTPEFERAVSEWALSFSEHVKSKGIDPKKIMFNTLDEPRNSECFKILEKWASAIRKSDAGFSIFSDPVELEKHDNMKYAPAALKYVNILCPLMEHYTVCYPQEICDFFQKERASGKELWFYMCTEPNRQFDPSYFRLQPWQAFKYGATGSGFWSFSATGHLASNWNPYLNLCGYDYSPVYIDPTSVTTAKQMESIREGIEDYQYLIMLRNAVSDNAAKEESDDVLKKTKELSGNRYWQVWNTNNTPCSFADMARNRILDKLEKVSTSK